MSKKDRSIEIDEDLGFLRKEWHFQRIGVAFMGVFVMAALLLSGEFDAGELRAARALLRRPSPAGLKATGGL